MSVEEMTAQVTAVLEEIRPHLQADGGDIVLVEVTEDGIVKVTLTGACDGCPMAEITLKNGIEKHLKEKVPGFQCVESVKAEE